MLDEHDEGWLICEDHCGKKFSYQKNLDAHLERVAANRAKHAEQVYTF